MNRNRVLEILNEELSFLGIIFVEQDFVFYEGSKIIRSKDRLNEYNLFAEGGIEYTDKEIIPKFSQSIIEYFWPSIEEAIVYKFLTLEDAIRTVAELQVRAYWFLKYGQFDEIKPLYKSLKLYPPLTYNNGGPNYEEEFKTNFCSSYIEAKALLDPNVLEEMMGNYGSEWVALKFKIINNRFTEFRGNNFRNILYLGSEKASNLKFLKKIRKKIQNETGYKINIDRISSMIKFTLPNDYKLENERRVFIREGEYPPECVKNDEQDNSYLNLPLNLDCKLTGCRIELLSYFSSEERKLLAPNDRELLFDNPIKQ